MAVAGNDRLSEYRRILGGDSTGLVIVADGNDEVLSQGYFLSCRRGHILAGTFSFCSRSMRNKVNLWILVLPPPIARPPKIPAHSTKPSWTQKRPRYSYGVPPQMVKLSTPLSTSYLGGYGQVFGKSFGVAKRERIRTALAREWRRIGVLMIRIWWSTKNRRFRAWVQTVHGGRMGCSGNGEGNVLDGSWGTKGREYVIHTAGDAYCRPVEISHLRPLLWPQRHHIPHQATSRHQYSSPQLSLTGSRHFSCLGFFLRLYRPKSFNIFLIGIVLKD